MALTKKTDSDLHLMFPRRTIMVTITHPEGDRVEFPELTPEQAETLWRMWYQQCERDGFDFHWHTDGDL